MNSRTGMRVGGLLAVVACAVLAACGGGSGGGGSTIPPSSSTPTPTPTATPTPPTGAVALSATASTSITLATAGSFTGGTFTMPAVSYSGATGTFSVSATLPSGVPTPQARNIRFTRVRAQNIGVNYTALMYLSATFNKSLSIGTTPGLLANFSSAPSGQLYLIEYDPAQPSAGWNAIAGPVAASGNSVTFTTQTGAVALSIASGMPYAFAVISTSSTIPTPGATPSPPPTPAAVGADATLPPVDTAPRTGWTAHQIATAFQFPVQSGYSGTGQTVVIVGDATPDPADVSTYLSTLGINRTGSYTVVPIATSAPAGDIYSVGEATLDVETVEGLAPGANVEFYYLADLSNQSFTAAEQNILSDTNNPHVMSISFGGCEYSGNLTTDDPLYSQGNKKGIAYFASAGDQGNECYIGPGQNDFQAGVNNPASDPNVIGVGGNENFNSTCHLGSLTAQYVWNDSCFQGQGGGGGGVSTLFTTLPSYQTGISGLASTSARNVPDVTLPSEGVAIYLQGGWQQYGGTSWSAPQMAAMFAELDEYCGGVPSNAVAEFYKAFQSNPHDFIDVLYGNNQYGAGSPAYGAAPGYDNASGLGMPYGMAVAQTLCPARTWTSRGVSSMGIARTESYGEARATSVGYAPNVRRFADLGERRGDDATTIMLTLRATPTLDSDEQTVIGDLQRAGFTIKQTWPTHLAIQASAPASVVASYFGTTIHNLDQGRYGTRYANATPAILPASIAPYVRGAILDNVVTRVPMSSLRSRI